MHSFQPENAPKVFGGRALPGPAGELTALPQPSPSCIKGVRVGTLEEEGERPGEANRGGREQGKEGRDGTEERRNGMGSMGEGGQEGCRKGGFRPTVISKSQCL